MGTWAGIHFWRCRFRVKLLWRISRGSDILWGLMVLGGTNPSGLRDANVSYEKICRFRLTQRSPPCLGLFCCGVYRRRGTGWWRNRWSKNERKKGGTYIYRERKREKMSVWERKKGVREKKKHFISMLLSVFILKYIFHALATSFWHYTSGASHPLQPFQGNR